MNAQPMRKHPFLSLLLTTAIAMGQAGCQKQTTPKKMVQASQPAAVGAYGQLVPVGEIRTLAGPSAGNNINSRVVAIFVKEGQAIRKGQVLAEMDSYRPLRATEHRLKRQVRNLRSRVQLLQRLQDRYTQLNRNGAYPIVDLEERKVQLLNLESSLVDAEDQLKQTQAQLANAVVVAPISGTVLRINSREGEQPSQRDGVMRVGKIENLVAALDVYASDAARVRVGQKVELRSEDGAFPGLLKARVYEILPQVSGRTVLPTDAPVDLGKRVLLVRASLKPEDRSRLRPFVGSKLLARFIP